MNWWHYLLLVNLYLVLFYCFYALLLRNETFFQLNRVYLVSAALLSFIIPGVQADWVKQLFITQKVHYAIYNTPAIHLRFTPVAVAATSITVGQSLFYIYIGGILFLAVRLLIQLSALKKAFKNPSPSAAFSFFKKITLGKNLVAQGAVMEHERVHAQQWHSLDILLMEAIMIVNWFNPVVYFYRFAIKRIHEFIADQQALKVGKDKAEYALLLLSQTFKTPTHRLVNPFYNHSLLKQRIIMIQKNRSQRVKLLKYGLSAPLFVLMLILSSATVNNSSIIKVIGLKTGELFDKPAAIAINLKSGNKQFTALVLGSSIRSNISSSGAANNYTDKVGADTGKIYSEVEKAPAFPGGDRAFNEFVSKHIKYPAAMLQNVVGGEVTVRFIVEKDGSLSDIGVIKSQGYGSAEEAVRVIGLSPKWIPGMLNGQAVRVQYAVPIWFTLNVDKPNNSYANIDTGHSRFVHQAVGDALVIINGKVVKSMYNLNPGDAQWIAFLSADSAKAKYGAKGANGAIVIITRQKGDTVNYIKVGYGN